MVDAGMRRVGRRAPSWGHPIATAAALVVLGCGSTEDPSPCTGDPGRLVVTADFLAGSLSLLSLSRLEAGCTAETSLVDRIDVSTYPAAPLEIELTPDGRTAVVSLSAGFFEGSGATLIGDAPIPPGGGLLVVDIETRAVRNFFEIGHTPMGIAISPDGRFVYTANYGRGLPGNSLSVFDLIDDHFVQEIAIGDHPEQIALSPDGSLGIVNLASEGGVRLFATADVAGSLSDLVATGADPSGVAFLGDRAIVANSAASSYTVLAVPSPQAVGVIETAALSAIPYAVTPLPGREAVLVTGIFAGVSLFVVDLTGVIQTIGLAGRGFPLSVAVSPDARTAIVPHALDHGISIVDLETQTSRIVSWLDAIGPTYAAIQR
jgi:hypothetical protein